MVEKNIYTTKVILTGTLGRLLTTSHSLCGQVQTRVMFSLPIFVLFLLPNLHSMTTTPSPTEWLAARNANIEPDAERDRYMNPPDQFNPLGDSFGVAYYNFRQWRHTWERETNIFFRIEGPPGTTNTVAINNQSEVDEVAMMEFHGEPQAKERFLYQLVHMFNQEVRVIRFLQVETEAQALWVRSLSFLGVGFDENYRWERPNGRNTLLK